MPNHFPEAFAALKQAAEGVITIDAALKKVIPAVLAAQEQSIDLGETVQALQAELLKVRVELGAQFRDLQQRFAAQETELRALRDRLNGRSDQR